MQQESYSLQLRRSLDQGCAPIQYLGTAVQYYSYYSPQLIYGSDLLIFTFVTTISTPTLARKEIVPTRNPPPPSLSRSLQGCTPAPRNVHHILVPCSLCDGLRLLNRRTGPRGSDTGCWLRLTVCSQVARGLQDLIAAKEAQVALLTHQIDGVGNHSAVATTACASLSMVDAVARACLLTCLQ